MRDRRQHHHRPRRAGGNAQIHRGTKIDNLVHIGHNCDIGENVILVALTGISGSCTVGKGAVLAGQVGMGDHAHIGPGVILGGQAGVLSGKTVTNEGLKPGTVLWGTPARPLKQVLRELAVLARPRLADAHAAKDLRIARRSARSCETSIARQPFDSSSRRKNSLGGRPGFIPGIN